MKNNTLMAMLLVGTAGSIASAGITSDSRTEFLGSVEQVVLNESFEGHDVNMGVGANTLNFSGFSASYDGPSAFGIDNELAEVYGVGATDGSNYIRTNFGGPEASSITFTFDTSVAHFGVMIRDLELDSLTFETDTGLTGLAFERAANGEAQFFGLSIAEGEARFSSITITSAALGDGRFDGAFLDQVTTGVPTPGSLALLGLGGLVAGRRRR